jgi:uncharacterized membrane protein YgdD (TMEM256/DUF423 family)
MNWIAVGAVAMAVGVGFGAFGAHGLRGVLDDYSMSVYERAVFYHYVHALGILIVAALDAAGAIPHARAKLANGLLLGGIFFFSGSLYVLALSGQRWLGAVTPIGGVAFIAAWLVLGWSAAGRRAA